MRLAGIWPFVVLGAIPLSGLPVAVQVGLVVGAVVLMIAQTVIARNPGTGASEASPDSASSHTWIVPPSADHPPSHATHDGATADGNGATGDWGASDSDADGGGDAGGGGD